MDVWQITVAALRRWYILLPLLALTAVGALKIGEGVHPQYEVTATAILVPGPEVTEIESPYGNRNETAQVLGILLGNTEARDAIETQGLSPEYEINVRDRSNIVNLTVLTDSEDESLSTGEAVLGLGQKELQQRQDAAGIPANAQIGLQILQPPTVSDVVAEGKLRNMAIVGILGAALSLLAAVLFDDLMGLATRSVRRWRGRQSADRPTQSTAAEVQEDPPVGQADQDRDLAAEPPHSADDLERSGRRR